MVEQFYEQYTLINQSLVEKGYKLQKVKNTFKLDNVSYKGVNNVYQTPSGWTFELQFHTKESFDLKDKVNHKLYEEARLLETSLERKKQLEGIMIENTNKLTIPKGVDKI